MTSAMNLAKYIVTKCVNDACPISNLQLQKILYYVQLVNLKKYRKPAFDDDIEAWKFGPVVPEVYYKFSCYGAMSILNQYDYYNLDVDYDLIDSIVDEKRELQPWDLVEETHRPGGAWDLTFRSFGNHSKIPLDLIRGDAEKYGC